MKPQNRNLIIVVALVLVVTGTMIVYNEWPLLFGKRMVLQLAPVDPFDPFLGQYLVVRYDISTQNTSGMKIGDTVYVSLREEDGIWRSTGAGKTKPTGDFIKGKVTSDWGDNLIVEYGIENFFFERNADLPTGNLTMEVRVDGSGRAKIYQMLKDGKPMKITYENVSLRS